MNNPLISQSNSALRNLRRDSGYVLLTGATGLVGQYLVRDLLQMGIHLAVVVRSSKRMSAAQRMEGIMQRWDRELERELPRPIVLEGDVSEPCLGLSPGDRAWVSRHCHSMIHNAAVVSFEGSDRSSEPFRSNLGGTQHAIDLYQETGLSEFHYVSTAYVCGRRQGRILECELDQGQEFRNAYEESKFYAEKAVVEQLPRSSTTIYRPTIIAGDSKTGFTSSYHGLMWYLRLMDILVPQQPLNSEGKHETRIHLPVAGDEPHNVVTVDFVTGAIARIFCNPAAHGRTFHLATKTPTTYREVIDSCCEIFNSAGVVYQADGKVNESQNAFAETIFAQSRVYQDYAVCETEFDTTNLGRFAPGFVSPVIDRVLIQKFMEFGRADRWGKSREVPPQVPVDVVGNLRARLHEAFPHGNRDGLSRLGIRVVGAGGGQWTVLLDKHDEVCLQTGISLSSMRLVDLSSRELVQDGSAAWVRQQILDSCLPTAEAI